MIAASSKPRAVGAVAGPGVMPGPFKRPFMSSGGGVVTPPAGDIPTTIQNSITYRGRTYTLDAAHPVGVFEDGSPFIVSDSGGQITNTSLNSSSFNADGYVNAGMMKNPGDLAAGQGFDAYMGDVPFKATAEIPYSAALNIDPGASDAATWGAGEKCSFVKAIPSPNKITHTDSFEIVETYDVITVLDAAPPVGTVRPCIQGTTKTLRSVNDTSFTPRGFTLPASYGAIADVIADAPELVSFFTESGEQRRVTKIDTFLGTTDDGYSGEHVAAHARYISALNSTAPSSAQRDQMIANILVAANDLEGFIDLGVTIGFGAGQGGGMWLWGMAAAHMLNDATLKAKIRAAGLQPDTAFWVDSSYFNTAAPGANGQSAQTFFDEHIDLPHVVPDEYTSGHGGRYFPIAAHIISSEVLALLSFTGGLSTFLDGNPNDETNDYAAALGLIARQETWDADWQVKYNYTQWLPDLWAIVKGDLTEWTGRPEQPPMANPTAYPGNDYFSAGAGDGEIVLDDLGIDFATETITQTDLEVSLDGTQWRRFSNITLSGGTFTQTGLLNGTEHWCRWRRESASGVSPWSGNYPFFLPYTDPPREVVTTAGTEAAAAPAFVVNPVACYRKYYLWDFPIWEEAPATGLGTEYRQFKAGLGYPSGSVEVADYSFQWKRDGVDISGATSQEYTIDPSEDAGADITCEVTIDNGTGTVSHTTAAVTLPEYPVFVVAQSSTGAADDTLANYPKTVEIGPANADRHLAFMVAGFHGGSAGVPTSMTIGGVACTRAVNSGTGSGNGSFAQIWTTDAKVPTGTTASLSITGGGTKMAVEVVRVIKDVTSLTVEDTAAGSSLSSAVQTETLDGTAGGVILGAIGTQGGSGGDVLAFDNPDIELTALARDINSQENVAFGLGELSATGSVDQSWSGKNQNNHAAFATIAL